MTVLTWLFFGLSAFVGMYITNRFNKAHYNRKMSKMSIHFTETLAKNLKAQDMQINLQKDAIHELREENKQLKERLKIV